MTGDEIKAIVEGIAPVIREHLATVTQRVDLVEKSMAAIIAKPHVKFCGVWTHGNEYTPGDAVTHAGGLWICKAATPGRPSEDFHGWQLAVKKGAAG
jgi:hypothetical protein